MLSFPVINAVSELDGTTGDDDDAECLEINRRTLGVNLFQPSPLEPLMF
jgi:hypothetical protein